MFMYEAAEMAAKCKNAITFEENIDYHKHFDELCARS